MEAKVEKNGLRLSKLEVVHDKEDKHSFTVLNILSQLEQRRSELRKARIEVSNPLNIPLNS